MGTIYELIGQADSALIWIEKSMELNPSSHKGSEWIHVKILEFKLSNSKKFGESVLGLDFGKQPIPQNPQNYGLDELEEHILHQIKERIYFVKPKNEIVGNVYFDLGNVIAQTRDVQSALECYEMAKEYEFDSELMQSRISKLGKLALKAQPDRWRVEPSILSKIISYFYPFSVYY
ncbi:MAG: tetratricopeptide (TPR) repeat protein [Flammeovirgaceae bacterium]